MTPVLRLSDPDPACLFIQGPQPPASFSSASDQVQSNMVNAQEDHPHMETPNSARENYEKGLSTPTKYDGENKKKFCTKMLLANVCIGLGALLVIIGIVYGTAVPSVVNNKIDDLVAYCKNGDYKEDKFTDSFGDCKDCNPFYYSYYPFNVTNAEEFLKGAKLQVQELGPYAFRKRIIKKDVRFDGKTVTYRSYNIWKFDPSQSCKGCSASDVSITFEVGYMAILSAAGGEYNFVKQLLLAAPGSTFTEDTVDAMVPLAGEVVLKLLYGYNSLSPEALQNLGSKAALALVTNNMADLLSLKMEGFDYNGMLVKRTVQQLAIGYPSLLVGLVLGQKYKSDCKGPGKLLEKCAKCVGDECNAIGPLCTQCQKAEVIVQMNYKACANVRDIYAAASDETAAKAFTAFTCDTCETFGFCAAQVPGAMEPSGFDWSQEEPPAVWLVESSQDSGCKDKSINGDYHMYQNATAYAIYAPADSNRNPTAAELTNFYGNCSEYTDSSNFTCKPVIGGDGMAFHPEGVKLKGLPSSIDQEQRAVFVSQAYQNVTLYKTDDKVKYEGISLIRYRPAADLLDPRPDTAKYGTGIPYKGLQPLSFIYGFLSYVSYPFYLYAEDHLLEDVDMTMIDGTKATKENIYEGDKKVKKVVYDRLSTYLDVEPASGKTMYAKKRMQGSVSVNRSPRNSSLPLTDLMHPNIKPETVFPYYWGEEMGFITSKNADRFKSELVAITKTFLPVFLVCIIVGLGVFAFGVWYFIRERRAMRAAKGGMEVA